MMYGKKREEFMKIELFNRMTTYGMLSKGGTTLTNKNYKRLTDTGIPTITPDDVYNRLYELENAIENGTLVFLPCKVGDKIWRLVDNWYETMIVEYTVEKIFVGKDCVLYIQDQMWHIPWTIDEVFFTKEAAEKALEEMKK